MRPDSVMLMKLLVFSSVLGLAAAGMFDKPLSQGMDLFKHVSKKPPVTKPPLTKPTLPTSATLPTSEKPPVTKPTLPTSATLPTSEKPPVTKPTLPTSATLPTSEKPPVTKPTLPTSATLPTSKKPPVTKPTLPTSATLPTSEKPPVTKPTLPTSATLPTSKKPPVTKPTLPTSATLPTSKKPPVTKPTLPTSATLPTSTKPTHTTDVTTPTPPCDDTTTTEPTTPNPNEVSTTKSPPAPEYCSSVKQSWHLYKSVTKSIDNEKDLDVKKQYFYFFTLFSVAVQYMQHSGADYKKASLKAAKYAEAMLSVPNDAYSDSELAMFPEIMACVGPAFTFIDKTCTACSIIHSTKICDKEVAKIIKKNPKLKHQAELILKMGEYAKYFKEKKVLSSMSNKKLMHSAEVWVDILKQCKAIIK